MSDIARTEKAYNRICSFFDEKGWKYEKKDNLTITTQFSGDDLIMGLTIKINPDLELVKIISTLPFEIKQDKLIEACVAVCAINYRLADGTFNCDIDDNQVSFMLSTFFTNTDLSDEAVNYMLSISLNTIDKYNDKLESLNNGDMSIDDFIGFVNA